MSKDEEDLWHKISQTIKPIAKKQASQHTQTAAITPKKPKNDSLGKHNRQQNSGQDTQQPTTPPHSPDNTAGIDRNTLARLKKGQIPIESTLDLHGLNQQQAHVAVERFICNAFAAGKRCVLVITGKGIRDLSGSGEYKRGVIRQAFPTWLKEPVFHDKILKYVPAAPKDGGQGAFYIYLKRSRKP